MNAQDRIEILNDFLEEVNTQINEHKYEIGWNGNKYIVQESKIKLEEAFKTKREIIKKLIDTYESLQLDTSQKIAGFNTLLKNDFSTAYRNNIFNIVKR